MQAVGFVNREPALPLEIFLEPAGADRDVAGQDWNPVVQDVDVGGLVADVDQPDHADHRLGIVDLEGVVERERVHVDERRLEPHVPEERELRLHQLALRGLTEESVAIAKIVDQDLHSSPVGEALFFHARYVSPRWKLQSRGPKPMKNCVAFIPVMRAVT